MQKHVKKHPEKKQKKLSMCFKQNSGAGAPDLCDDIALKVFCRTAAGVHAPPQLVALQAMEAIYPGYTHIGPILVL